MQGHHPSRRVVVFLLYNDSGCCCWCGTCRCRVDPKETTDYCHSTRSIVSSRNDDRPTHQYSEQTQCIGLIRNVHTYIHRYIQRESHAYKEMRLSFQIPPASLFRIRCWNNSPQPFPPLLVGLECCGSFPITIWSIMLDFSAFWILFRPRRSIAYVQTVCSHRTVHATKLKQREFASATIPNHAHNQSIGVRWCSTPPRTANLCPLLLVPPPSLSRV